MVSLIFRSLIPTSSTLSTGGIVILTSSLDTSVKSTVAIVGGRGSERGRERRGKKEGDRAGEKER